MSWIYLVLAGFLEVAWAYSLKLSQGFSRPFPTAATVVLMIASFGLLSLALRQLPMGTAYAAWTGIGAVGAAIVGMVFLGEPRDVVRILCVGLIAAGIVGLKMTS